MNWNYRTILHYHSGLPEEEDYLTAHEAYYEDGKLRAFVATPASPRSKEDAENIMKAFDHLPIVRVDDASLSVDHCGRHDYATWSWITP